MPCYNIYKFSIRICYYITNKLEAIKYWNEIMTGLAFNENKNRRMHLSILKIIPIS